MPGEAPVIRRILGRLRRGRPAPAQPARRGCYLCPGCNGHLRPHDGPWSVWHCIPCNSTYDLYNIDAELEWVDLDDPPEPYDPLRHAVVIDVRR